MSANLPHAWALSRLGIMRAMRKPWTKRHKRTHVGTVFTIPLV